MSFCIDYSDVIAAAKRLKGHAVQTRLISHPVINNMAGCTVYLKLECEQHVGAFKYRGARNRLAAMSAAERAKGVVAYSSGNHAQGVARAARELGISAIIVMPDDAPNVKVAGVRADGAEIVFYDKSKDSREDIAADIAQRDDRIIVPSFDDPHIIAGQGTVGLEIMKQCTEANISLDAAVICMGGGGLCAGSSLAIHQAESAVDIYGAEPKDYNDHQRSIQAGERVSLEQFPESLCDALLTPAPGTLTFPINKAHVKDVCTVSDIQCLLTMAVLKNTLGIIAEPGGVVALASILSGQLSRRGYKTICAVISGGNVDPEVMTKAEALL